MPEMVKKKNDVHVHFTDIVSNDIIFDHFIKRSRRASFSVVKVAKLFKEES